MNYSIDDTLNAMDELRNHLSDMKPFEETIKNQRDRIYDLEETLYEIGFGWEEEIHGEMHRQFHDEETIKDMARRAFYGKA